MRSKTLVADGATTHVLICDKGDDPVQELERFTRDHSLLAASFKAIGTFRDVTLGWFDPDAKAYRRNNVREQVEVVSLIGDIAVNDGKPAVHAHVVVAQRDGHALGGHLMNASVWPTLEIVLTETPGTMQKRDDPQTGLALIDPDA